MDDGFWADMSGAECKVLVVFLRKTYGWNKLVDSISQSQIAQGSGVKDHKTVAKACASLEKLGFIQMISEPTHTKPAVWRMVMMDGGSGENPHREGELFPNEPKGGGKIPMGEGELSPVQKTSKNNNTKIHLEKTGFASDCEVIAKLANRRTLGKDVKFQRAYIKAVGSLGQEMVSQALLMYCRSEWHRQGKKWNFVKLLNSDEMVETYAGKVAATLAPLTMDVVLETIRDLNKYKRIDWLLKNSRMIERGGLQDFLGPKSFIEIETQGFRNRATTYAILEALEK